MSHRYLFNAILILLAFIHFLVITSRGDAQEHLALPQLIQREDFESGKKTSFFRDLRHEKRISIAKNGSSNQGHSLRVDYELYGGGTRGVYGLWKVKQPMLSATLVYDMYFEEGFVWQEGGKLPGLGPLKPVIGGRPLTDQGWSVRLMWRNKGGDLPQTMQTYLYHHQKTRKYGAYSYAKKLHLKSGRWYQVMVYLRLNSKPDIADGVVSVYLDGIHLITHRQLRFRASEHRDALINGMMVHTYHGGHDKRWIPRDEAGQPKEVFMRFDNLEIWSGNAVAVIQNRKNSDKLHTKFKINLMKFMNTKSPEHKKELAYSLCIKGRGLELKGEDSKIMHQIQQEYGQQLSEVQNAALNALLLQNDDDFKSALDKASSYTNRDVKKWFSEIKTLYEYHKRVNHMIANGDSSGLDRRAAVKVSSVLRSIKSLELKPLAEVLIYQLYSPDQSPQKEK